MSQKLILERYINYFGTFYEGHNYIKNKKLSQFIKCEFGAALGPSSKHQGCAVVRPYFFINNLIINEIVLKVITQTAGLTYLRVQTSEFAHELGIYNNKIDNSPYNHNQSSYYYDIEIDTDLEPIFQDHKYYVETVVFPFFEKMSSLEGIDAFINGRQMEGDDEYFKTEERQKFLQRYNEDNGTFSGLISAKLIQNPLYEEVKIRYRYLFKDYPYMLEKVEKLIFYLDSHY